MTDEEQRELRAVYDNLTATQQRCNSLLEEAREARRQALALEQEVRVLRQLLADEQVDSTELTEDDIEEEIYPLSQRKQP
jgi:hypothetical protein